MTSGVTTEGTTSSVFYRRKSWNGSNSPLFPDVLTENPYSLTIFTRYSPVLGWYYVNSSGDWVRGGEGKGRTLGFGDLSDDAFFMPDNDVINAQNRLIAKVKGHSFNAAVSFAEGKETYGMISSNCIDVFRAYRSLRRGEPKRAIGFLVEGNKRMGRHWQYRVRSSFYSKSLASRWLSLRYGWTPLLSDIHEGLKLIEAQSKKQESSPVTVRVSAKAERSSIQSQPSFPGWSQVNQNTLRVTAKIKQKFLTSYPTLAEAGVLDPELVAWELLPWSFVADWFLPVGSYLEARAALPRIEAQYIITKMVHARWSGYSDSTAKPGYRIHGNTAAHTESFKLNRTIAPSWPVPTPSFQNPLLGPWKHAVDAVAFWRGSRR